MTDVMTLKVMTLNGRPLAATGVDLIQPLISNTLDKFKPDVVFMQELADSSWQFSGYETHGQADPKDKEHIVAVSVAANDTMVVNKPSTRMVNRIADAHVAEIQKDANVDLTHMKPVVVAVGESKVLLVSWQGPSSKLPEEERKTIFWKLLQCIRDIMLKERLRHVIIGGDFNIGHECVQKYIDMNGLKVWCPSDDEEKEKKKKKKKSGNFFLSSGSFNLESYEAEKEKGFMAKAKDMVSQVFQNPPFTAKANMLPLHSVDFFLSTYATDINMTGNYLPLIKFLMESLDRKVDETSRSLQLFSQQLEADSQTATEQDKLDAIHYDRVVAIPQELDSIKVKLQALVEFVQSLEGKVCNLPGVNQAVVSQAKAVPDEVVLSAEVSATQESVPSAPAAEEGDQVDATPKDAGALVDEEVSAERVETTESQAEPPKEDVPVAKEAEQDSPAEDIVKAESVTSVETSPPQEGEGEQAELEKQVSTEHVSESVVSEDPATITKSEVDAGSEGDQSATVTSEVTVEGGEVGFQAEVQVEAQAEPQPEVEAEVQSEVQTEVQSEIQPEVQADVQAEVKSEGEVQSEVQVDVQAEEKSEAQAEVQAEVQGEVQSEVQAEVQSEDKSEVQAAVQSEVPAEVQAEDAKEPTANEGDENKNEIVDDSGHKDADHTTEENQATTPNAEAPPQANNGDFEMVTEQKSGFGFSIQGDVPQGLSADGGIESDSKKAEVNIDPFAFDANAGFTNEGQTDSTQSGEGGKKKKSSWW